MLQKAVHRPPRSGRVSWVNIFERVLRKRVGRGEFRASIDCE